MRQQTAPARLLADAGEALARWGGLWYLFGAQAVVVWGRPRLTADVDITVRLNPEDTLGFCAAMEAAGFRLRVSDPRTFLARTSVLPFVHEATRLPLDVVLAGPGLEEHFLERAVLVEIEGLQIPVISPEDLIVSKILAGRPKDIEDVRSVMAERCDSLDSGQIRSTLGLLEQALAQSDLLSVFDAELARARGR